MRVLHIIPSVRKSDGGPARSSQGLVAALNEAGVEAMLVSCHIGDSAWIPGVNRFAAPTKIGCYEKRRLLKQTILDFNPDIIHLHAIWLPEIHFAASLARQYHIPYVQAPRGMIQPWALKQKWLKKKIAWWLYQRLDFRRSSAFHVTSASEGEQVRKLGCRQSIIQLPNGVNVPDEIPVWQRDASCPRVLYVGRMHPSKGLRLLVEAWGKKKMNGWKCELVYETHDEYEAQFEKEIKERVQALNLDDDFVFTGPLSDKEKWLAYRRADLFVSPSYSENFGITVVEALYAGVPVITTKGTPWQELETIGCGKWIEIGADSLAAALDEIMSFPKEKRDEMGVCGRRLVEEKYLWPSIAKQMVEQYRAIIKNPTGC